MKFEIQRSKFERGRALGVHPGTTTTERETSRLAAAAVAKQVTDYSAGIVCPNMLRARDGSRSGRCVKMSPEEIGSFTVSRRDQLCSAWNA